MSAAAGDRPRATTAEPDPHTTAGKLADLHRRIDEAVHAGSAAAVERQHAKGRQTARERIEMLLDPGSFVELDELVRHRSTNFGMQEQRPVRRRRGHRHRHDRRPTGRRVQPGRHGVRRLARRGVRREDRQGHGPRRSRPACPMIGINDGGGARIQEGVVALGLYGEIFVRNVRSSGVDPADLADHGPVRGRGGVLPRDHRLHVMVDGTSHMFITGPDVIKTVTGEDVEMEDLGGGRAHNTKSGVAHYLGRRRGRTRSPTSRSCCRSCRATTCPTRRRSPRPSRSPGRSPTRSPTPTSSSTRSSRTRRTPPTTSTR